MNYFIKIGELAPLGLVTFVIAYLVKLLVKKINNHDLDIALTPSWLVLVEQIVVTLIASVLITPIALLGILNYYEISMGNFLKEDGIYELIFGVYITTTLIVFFLWFYTKWMKMLFCGHKVFRTVVGEELWRIDHAASKKTLFLSIDNRKLQYTYDGRIEIFAENKQSQYIKGFYSKIGNIQFYRTAGSILYFIVIGLNIYSYFYFLEKIIYILFGSLLFLILLFSFMIGYRIFESESNNIVKECARS